MFKIYRNTKSFDIENDIKLDLNIDCFNIDNFIFKFINECHDEAFLYKNKESALNVCGNESLIDEIVDTFIKYNLRFNEVCGNLSNLFIDKYNKLMPKNIKTLELAGGCFWCMAHPYYEYDGIIHVYSGFVGDDDNFINPSYEDVKKGLAKFRETIMIVYDENKIKAKDILKIYFNEIDPFDDKGQYIDKGFNYTLRIFTSDNEIKKIAKDYINKLEDKYKLKCAVKIYDEHLFYMAEEYHQDYGIKNPEKIVCELKESGRLNKKRYTVDD